MWNFSVSETEDGYVVLADGRPQLLFETASQAAAVIEQVAALDRLPRLFWRFETCEDD